MRISCFFSDSRNQSGKKKNKTKTNERNGWGKKGTEWGVEEVRREIEERKMRRTGAKSGRERGGRRRIRSR